MDRAIWKKWTLVLGGVLLVSVLAFIFLKPSQSALAEEEVRASIGEQFAGTVQAFAHTKQNGVEVYQVTFLTETGLYGVLVDPYSGEILSLKQLADRMQIEPEGNEGESPKNSELTVEQVKELIAGTVEEDVTIVEIEQRQRNERPFYAVVIEQREGVGKIEIDAITGEVLNYRVEEEPEKEPPRDDQPAQTITKQEAERIALEQVAGHVEDVDLEDEDGRLFYEVEIEIEGQDGDEATVLIDAITGEVITIIWED
ncbi:PepSY domain-containing protein [Alkalihalobacillus oceani]|uniref:PepSY domain-containing protein n=1 Tax=Halalkalibacter oceani TaxID=1653776 RepID=UPI0020426270|nr:PepSY domain-containing protein [Halalkalibacter oceani]MCM3762825.1 PepSY domain-containing protein [Halalkalibacter oceani]